MVVVFFGTPEFAVPSLRALVGEGFDVRAVVTRPDRPQGRSRSTLVPSPVKVAAQAEDQERVTVELLTQQVIHRRDVLARIRVVRTRARRLQVVALLRKQHAS